MKKEQQYESQMSFLPPEDAALVTLMRYFVAEAARIYETRMTPNLEESLVIGGSNDAYNFLRVEMEHLEQEQLRTIHLNTHNKIISSRMIYQGTINSANIRLSEVFRPAVLDNAHAIVVCHNHPSGDPSPSGEDVNTTKGMILAGELLGIEVLDHIIIGKGKYVSLKERGLWFTG